MPNLSNYGNFFINLSVCCDISEKNVVIFVHIWYNYQLQLSGYHACKITIMATFSYILCVCYMSEKNWLVLFIFGTVIKYHMLPMHVKYHLALCLLRYLSKELVDFVHIWYSNQPK